jgi:hypothetical protein
VCHLNGETGCFGSGYSFDPLCATGRHFWIKMSIDQALILGTPNQLLAFVKDGTIKGFQNRIYPYRSVLLVTG